MNVIWLRVIFINLIGLVYGMVVKICEIGEHLHELRASKIVNHILVLGKMKQTEEDTKFVPAFKCFQGRQ